jgi:hypothetical protein
MVNSIEMEARNARLFKRDGRPAARLAGALEESLLSNRISPPYCSPGAGLSRLTARSPGRLGA